MSQLLSLPRAWQTIGALLPSVVVAMKGRAAARAGAPNMTAALDKPRIANLGNDGFVTNYLIKYSWQWQWQWKNFICGKTPKHPLKPDQSRVKRGGIKSCCLIYNIQRNLITTCHQLFKHSATKPNPAHTTEVPRGSAPKRSHRAMRSGDGFHSLRAFAYPTSPNTKYRLRTPYIVGIPCRAEPTSVVCFYRLPDQFKTDRLLETLV